MAKKETPKTVETITHEEARRKNIPTAEFQSVMGKEEQHPIRVSMPRGVAVRSRDGLKGALRLSRRPGCP
jgi:hypothetical protein